MMNFLKDFYYEEEGMGTVEIVIIIAVLIAIALVFKGAITGFAKNLMIKAFNTDANKDNTAVTGTVGDANTGLGN